MSSFDLAIIGAGPGGFDAALRARELGFKVSLIEKSDAGGTCLNTGCIPTKALLASTKLLTQIQQAESYGLSLSGVCADLGAMVERKQRIVETLKKGMTDTLRRSGVEWIQGEASFVGNHRLCVTGKNQTQELEARWILIATGAEPAPFPEVPFNGKNILSSTDLLELEIVPKRLLIIGGGVIGVEFASIFQPLGTHVMIVEMLERLIWNEDEEIGRRLESVFRRKGMEIYTGVKVRSLKASPKGVEARLESGEKLAADLALVATGRIPHTRGLGLEKMGIKLEKGAICVNEYLETSGDAIFAIGDVTNRTTGLAHGASAEAIRAIENLKGRKEKMDYGAIPNCIYTDPEVASVGLARSVGTGSSGGTSRTQNVQETCPSENRYREIVEGKILFSSLGKSHIEGETEGFVKMIVSKKNGRILGVAGIGGRMTELIHEATLAVKAGLSVQTLAQTVHAHPTEGEILQKAAADILKRYQVPER